MSIKSFNTRAQKLLKKCDIKFVDFVDNWVTLKDGTKVPLVPVMYKGEMRFAVQK